MTVLSPANTGTPRWSRRSRGRLLGVRKSTRSLPGLNSVSFMRSGRNDSTPVAFFEELYAIVVGLGLALAVEQVIDLNRSGLPVATEHIPVFLGYLNIAFALAHASVRYLQLAYVESALGSMSRGRVVADLVLGVGHFLWLMALSF